MAVHSPAAPAGDRRRPRGRPAMRVLRRPIRPNALSSYQVPGFRRPGSRTTDEPASRVWRAGQETPREVRIVPACWHSHSVRHARELTAWSSRHRIAPCVLRDVPTMPAGEASGTRRRRRVAIRTRRRALGWQGRRSFQRGMGRGHRDTASPADPERWENAPPPCFPERVRRPVSPGRTGRGRRSSVRGPALDS